MNAAHEPPAVPMPRCGIMRSFTLLKAISALIAVRFFRRVPDVAVEPASHNRAPLRRREIDVPIPGWWGGDGGFKRA